jgi:uncharacterized protein
MRWKRSKLWSAYVLIPDLNLLLYAHDSQSSRHIQARQWWEALLNSQRPVGLAWVTILGFIRLTTHPKLAANPLTPKLSIEQVRNWLAVPSVRIVTPGQDHGVILFRLLEQVGVAGNLTTDAHLAAIAIEYQAELASTDSDFTRFAGLRLTNPLPKFPS